MFRSSKTGINFISKLRVRDVFTVEVEPYDYIVGDPPSSTEEAVGDLSISDRYDGAEVEKSFRLTSNGGKRYIPSNSSKATLESDNTLTRQGAGGEVRVVGINTRGKKVLSNPLLVYNAPSLTTYEFNRWVDGTYAKYVADAIDDALPDEYDVGKKDIFTSFQYRVGGIRNPNCWAAEAGWDLSCISVNKPNSCLIGSDIVLQAKHYPDTGTVAFTDMDGNSYTRTVVGWVDIRLPFSWNTFLTADFRIAKLDSPLPPSVKPALLPPVDLEGYLSDFNREIKPEKLLEGIPFFVSDQQKHALVTDLQYFEYRSNTESETPGPPRTECKKPTKQKRINYYEDLIAGDSGSNAFFPPLPGDDRLTVMIAWTGGGAGAGSSIEECLRVNEFQQAVLDLGCVGSLEFVDLSAFTKFA